MYLRNKKTGEVVDWSFVGPTAIKEYEGEDVLLERERYESIEEFISEWEDYTPAEPLIKDEKIRKAVRAWAEANDLLTFKVVNEHFDCFKIIGYGDHNISSCIEFKSTIAYANKDQFYTIDELCGEEEENV